METDGTFMPALTISSEMSFAVRFSNSCYTLYVLRDASYVLIE